MNRILQFILGLIFLQHVLALLIIMTYLPARIFNFSKQMKKEFSYPEGQQKFESSTSLGPLRLSHMMEYDSVLGKGVRGYYASLPHLVPNMIMNGKPVVKDAKGEPVIARFAERNRLDVPISPDRYLFILTLSFVLLLFYLLILLYLMVELFRFSKQAGRQEFFNARNQRRLRLLGAFMLLTAIFSYAANTAGAWWLHQLTGTSGYRHDAQSSDFVYFPITLVAGLLMFIVANAFGKGQDLQTEQDLTI